MLWQRKFHKHLFVSLAQNGTVSRNFYFLSFVLGSCYPMGLPPLLSHCYITYFQRQALLCLLPSKPLGSVSKLRFPGMIPQSVTHQQQLQHLKLGSLTMEWSWSRARYCCHLMLLCQLLIRGQKHERMAFSEQIPFEFHCTQFPPSLLPDKPLIGIYVLSEILILSG